MIQEKQRFNFGPLFIALAAFIWTTDGFFRGSLKGKLTSMQITLLDHYVILIIISPLIIKYVPILIKFNRKEWFAILWIGIGGSALATVALTEGFFLGDFPYQYAAVVVLLQQVQPIIAIGLAHLLLKERLPSFFYILSATSILGVILIILPHVTYDSQFVVISNFTVNTGLYSGILALTAAILWGSSTVFGRYLLEHSEKKLEYKQMTTFRFFIAAIFLTIFVGFYPAAQGYPSISSLSLKTTLSIIYLAMVVGLLSLILYYYGLKTTKASISAIAELTYPLSFFVILPLFNVQQPSVIQFIGAAVLIVSSTLISYNYGKVNVNAVAHQTLSSQ